MSKLRASIDQMHAHLRELVAEADEQQKKGSRTPTDAEREATSKAKLILMGVPLQSASAGVAAGTSLAGGFLAFATAKLPQPHVLATVGSIASSQSVCLVLQTLKGSLVKGRQLPLNTLKLCVKLLSFAFLALAGSTGYEMAYLEAENAQLRKLAQQLLIRQQLLEEIATEMNVPRKRSKDFQ